MAEPPAAAFPHTFQSLYENHYGWLASWLRRKLHCKADAPDLAQDTFVRILSHPDARVLETLREPRHYLVTIANRVVVDYLRRQTLEQAILDAMAQMPESHGMSPETRAVVIETLTEIDAMLHGLGVKVRSTFLMSQLEGMAYADIAAQLGVSISSVKKYVARATEHCLLYALETGA